MSRDLTPAEQAFLERWGAGWREYTVARFNLDIAASEAGASLGRLARAVQAAEDREVAEHPDLAEINVRLDALFDLP